MEEKAEETQAISSGKRGGNDIVLRKQHGSVQVSSVSTSDASISCAVANSSNNKLCCRLESCCVMYVCMTYVGLVSRGRGEARMRTDLL